MKCFWLFGHNWTKWVEVEGTYGYVCFNKKVTKVIQVRWCKDCNLCQTRDI